MDRSTPGSSVAHYLPEFAPIHVHRVTDPCSVSITVLQMSASFCLWCSLFRTHYLKHFTTTSAYMLSHFSLPLWPHGLYSPPGSSVHEDSPGKNTGVSCHFLFQRISPTQGLNPGLPHCGQILYRLSHQRAFQIIHAWAPEVSWTSVWRRSPSISICKKLPGCSNIQSRLRTAARMIPAVFCLCLSRRASSEETTTEKTEFLLHSWSRTLGGFPVLPEHLVTYLYKLMWPPLRGLFYPFSFFSNLLSSSVQSHLAGEFASSFTGKVETIRWGLPHLLAIPLPHAGCGHFNSCLPHLFSSYCLTSMRLWTLRGHAGYLPV